MLMILLLKNRLDIIITTFLPSLFSLQRFLHTLPCIISNLWSHFLLLLPVCMCVRECACTCMYVYINIPKRTLLSWYVTFKDVSHQ